MRFSCHARRANETGFRQGIWILKNLPVGIEPFDSRAMRGAPMKQGFVKASGFSKFCQLAMNLLIRKYIRTYCHASKRASLFDDQKLF